jgi:hypothetical protein
MAFHLSRAPIWQVLYPFSISCLQIVPFLQPPGVSADVRPAPSTRPANARIPAMVFMLSHVGGSLLASNYTSAQWGRVADACVVGGLEAIVRDAAIVLSSAGDVDAGQEGAIRLVTYEMAGAVATHAGISGTGRGAVWR